MQETAVLGAGELLDLALLGRLAEQPRPLDQLIAFIKAACGDDLTPTSDVIGARLERLIDGGLVTQVGEQPPLQLTTTRAGATYLLRLLRLELDPASGRLRSFCTAMKLCFLELVGRETRAKIVEELIAMRRLQLDRLAAARDQPCVCPALERCLALAMQRERAELGWLEQFLLKEARLDPLRW